KENLARTVEFCKEFKEVTRVKYMSALPGTPLYYDAIRKGVIKDPLRHLYFLSRERAVENDKFLNFSGVPEKDIRRAYRLINRQIEVRPYEYWNPINHYLTKPEKFKSGGIFKKP
ncbi:MAG: hypothetical protein PHX28_01430, partial [Candidatus Omnitrophica bacterium]|nr:hypothetical protein [Candidatus Omnitrophota bacterium]